MYYGSSSQFNDTSKEQRRSCSPSPSGRRRLSETVSNTTPDLKGSTAQNASTRRSQGGRPRHDSSSSEVCDPSRDQHSDLHEISSFAPQQEGFKEAGSHHQGNIQSHFESIEGLPAPGQPSTFGEFAGEPESLLNMPLIEVPDSLPTESDAWKVTPLYQPDSHNNSSCLTVSTSYLRIDAFANHRDTLARIRYSRGPAPHIPVPILARICHYLSFQDYKALRLTTKIWLRALPSPYLPPLYTLPREVIQEIYAYLRPQDFNAARHTCHAWLLASLEKRLLIKMLKQSGYWHAARIDLQRRDNRRSASNAASGRLQVSGLDGPADHRSDSFPSEIETEEWLLSRRLATECMLSSEWRGNSSSVVSRYQRFSSAATIDFKEYVATSHNPPLDCTNSEPRSRPTFTVSGCGRFVLVSQDRVVSIYKILDHPTPALKATTSIHCPCKVRAVSMDTSCGRFAVAALLDCRMGMVCDVRDAICNTCETKSWSKSYDFDAFTFTSLDRLPQSSRHTSQSMPQDPRQIMTTQTYADKSSAKGKKILSPAQTFHPGVKSASVSRRSSTPGIPIETGPRSIYRNLGSVEDPPRSVAICPQRRCVAFGCGLGVELHWIDAMSEADLNRWFPLSAPADFLFFLPPRAQADNPSKLRLISSAARRTQVESNAYQTSARHSVSTLLPSIEPNMAHSRFMTRLFFGSLPTRTIASSIQQVPGHLPSRPLYDSGLLRAVECDHYRAVPLADGVHSLFTVPETGLLCLGSDAPLGNPTKLLRKVVFVPPKDPAFLQATSLAWPLHYTAGSDVSRGVRVVASYNDHIILYSLPTDIFEKLRRMVLPFAGVDNLVSTGSQHGTNDLLMDSYVQAQNDETESSPKPDHLLSRVALGTGSVRIEGVYVGYLTGTEAFSVQCSHGGVRIWAFSNEGQGCIWDIERKTIPEEKIVIHAHGKAETLRDAAQRNDVLMEDDLSADWDDPSSYASPLSVSTPSPTSTRPDFSRRVTFSDGAAECCESITTGIDEEVERLFDEADLQDCCAYDAERI